MDEVIKWVNNRGKSKDATRVPAARLSQFEKEGYRIHQYDEEFFVVERLKSTKIVQCCDISDAEQIATLAITLEKIKDMDLSSYKKSISDKAATLVGLIDVMYTSTGGDKVRRRTWNAGRNKLQNPR